MSGQTPVSMIVAMAQGGVIGIDNKLPWRLPADLAFFKRTTMGHPVIMGRKTYESIGKPLPGRMNVVLTRDSAYTADGCTVVHTPEEALQAAAGQNPFVIGGSEVYGLFFGFAERIYVTLIEEHFEGDAYFPEINPDEWQITSREAGTVDEKNVHPHTFLTFERKPK